MKKLAFLFVTVAAFSFASCGNKAASNNEEAGDVMEVVEEAVENAAEETEAVEGDSTVVEETVEAEVAE